MTQARKSYARQGRGAGNGYNENWQNSPLWDNIEKKKYKNSETPDDKIEQDVTETNDEYLNESLKDKQKRMFSMVY